MMTNIYTVNDIGDYLYNQREMQRRLTLDLFVGLILLIHPIINSNR